MPATMNHGRKTVDKRLSATGWWACFGLAISVMLSSVPAWAQSTYPDKPIRLVVPFPAGGGADNLAREVIPHVSEVLGTPIVIENKAGAGGNVGAMYVARAAPDGYTLLHGTNGTHGINQALYANTGFDPIKDFTPISRLTSIPAALVVHPDLPVNSVEDLIKYMRAHPGKVFFASAGNGTTSHMAGTLFKLTTGVDIVHVPYKGGGAALVGLLGGEVQMMVDLMANVYPQVKAGKLKVLAVTTRERVSTAPDIPTLREAGVPDAEITATDGIYAPAGTPPAIVNKLNAAFRQVLTEPKVRDRLIARGAFPTPSTPEQLGEHIAAELPKWIKLVKESGAKVD